MPSHQTGRPQHPWGCPPVFSMCGHVASLWLQPGRAGPYPVEEGSPPDL